MDFTEIIYELNDSLEGNKYLENWGLCFNYRTYGFVDIIYFGEQVVYYSEQDSTYDYDKNVEISIKDVTIKNFKEYVKALKQVKL